MIDKDRIKKEAEAFFDWPTDDKSAVSTISMILFAGVIAGMAREEEREACAKVCEAEYAGLGPVWNHQIAAANACATSIRARSNDKGNATETA